MKVLSTEGLTKLIQLIKSAFISVDDTVSTNTVALATVATSGSYNDLSNTPTIPIVDQTYNASSANAQSGVAIAGANFLVNNAASSTNGVAVKGSGNVQSTQIGALGSAASMSTSVGFSAYATGSQSITIGHGAQASASKSYAFGEQAKSTAIGAFQFGQATNSEAGSVYFGLTTDGSTTTNYKLLGPDGKIPDDRLNATIARTSAIPDVDNKSITTNTSDELQTVGVIDSNNTTNAIKTWTGTKAQYDAITTKDATTLYNITDDTDVTIPLLELLYPVGSLYIATSNLSVCPLAVLGVGTWQLKANSTLVTDVDSTAPVIGDGNALGLTDGTSNAGLANYSNSLLETRTGNYGVAVGTSNTGSNLSASKAIGVTTDPTKSGIEANITSTTLSVTIWERVS